MAAEVISSASTPAADAPVETRNPFHGLSGRFEGLLKEDDTADTGANDDVELAEDADDADTDAEASATAQAPEAPAPTLQTPSNFTVTDKDGTEFEVEWPTGAQLRFKADGREVAVDSLDTLVKHASMGVYANRRLSQLGQEVRGAKDAVKAKETEIAQAREWLFNVIYDDAQIDELREQLADYRNPEIREALIAKQMSEASAAQAASELQAQEQQRVQEFEGRVETLYTEALAHLPMLDADDLTTVAEAFEAQFQRELATLQQRYEEDGADETAAYEQAHGDVWNAMANDEGFLRVAVQLNDELQARADRRPNTSPAPRTAPPAKTAEHNAKAEARLSASTTRTLRGGQGAAASAVGLQSVEGLTWEQRKERRREFLRNA